MLVNELIQQLKQNITEINPDQAFAQQQQGALLLDVRELDEVKHGMPKDALHITRSFLEWKASKMIPDLNTPILTICGSGARSLFAAQTLKSLGYQQVSSVAGGFTQWQQEGLPTELP